MWFYSFIKKHAGLQLLKPTKLNIERAECALAGKAGKWSTQQTTLDN
jgi:hypothetical protein